MRFLSVERSYHILVNVQVYPQGVVMKARIVELCKAQGMSKTELAKQADVSLRAINKWCLHGLDKAWLGHIKRIADALDCSIEDLIDE